LALALFFVGLFLHHLAGKETETFWGVVACLCSFWLVGFVHILRGHRKARHIREDIQQVVTTNRSVASTNGKAVGSVGYAVTRSKMFGGIDSPVRDEAPDPLVSTLKVVGLSILASIPILTDVHLLPIATDLMKLKILGPAFLGWCFVIYGCFWCYARAIKAWGRKRAEMIAASVGLIVVVGCAAAIAYWIRIYSSG
jgi:hypothetical protein